MTIERIGDKIKPCTYCAQHGHTAWKCPRKPRTTLKTTKRMSTVGKVGRQTSKAVAKWKAQTPSNHQGYWQCYMCFKWIDYLVAEHFKSKARNPHLRTELTNLKPTCNDCNRNKGSRDN